MDHTKPIQKTAPRSTERWFIPFVSLTKTRFETRVKMLYLLLASATASSFKGLDKTGLGERSYPNFSISMAVEFVIGN